MTAGADGIIGLRLAGEDQKAGLSREVRRRRPREGLPDKRSVEAGSPSIYVRAFLPLRAFFCVRSCCDARPALCPNRFRPNRCAVLTTLAKYFMQRSYRAAKLGSRIYQVLKLRNSKRQRSRNSRRERLRKKGSPPAVGDVVEGYVRKAREASSSVVVAVFFPEVTAVFDSL